MNEEEVIERLNRFKTIKVLYGNTFAIHLEQLKQLQNDIETVLNLLEKKDKMINEMAIAIGNEPLPTEEYCIFRNFDCPAVGGNRDCKECVKQYFEREVENGNFNFNVDWYDFGCLVQLGYKWIKDGCLYDNPELLGGE